jgi:hypothetical protein
MLRQFTETTTELERDGFCLLRSVVKMDQLNLLVDEIEKVRDSKLSPGLRHLLCRSKVEGYGPWSMKDGIMHVQPPARILQTMVSLRIHLDACCEANGAIKFISGSHVAGILDPVDLVNWRDSHSPTICPAERGDVIVMLPLVLHSSSPSQAPDHRRVLHIEYASAILPPGMEWEEA